MITFRAVLLLLAAAVSLSAIARWIRVPFPALLALAGAALSFAPIEAPFQLDPDLALVLFVAPVLLDAAYDASPRDLRFHWRALTSLVFVAVGLTTVAVAYIARRVVPDLPWSAAIALGAIVAPPDAAAATAVLRQVRLPHHIVVVLEGESLLNDATALLIYRVAVSSAVAGSAVVSQIIAPSFLPSIAGSLVAGYVLAHVSSWVLRRMTDMPSTIVVQFMGTFSVWLIADHLGMSPVLTVVAFAVTLSRFGPARTPARIRAASNVVWDTAVVVLNALAFMLVGLQLRTIVAAAPPGELRGWLVFAGAVFATVIAVRLIWVMASNAWTRPRGRHAASAAATPAWKSGLVISWCGMRGIVTLATALALPERFPYRDLLLFTAFAITLGTLVVQGLTLRPLLRTLALPDDGVVEAEIRIAREALASAALALIETERSAEAEGLRRDLELQRDTARAAHDGEGRARSVRKEILYRTLVRRRERLLQLRAEQAIGDEAFHRLEDELDIAELATR